MRAHQSRGSSKFSRERDDPLEKVEWARILDQEKAGDEICIVTEQGMNILRIEPKANMELQKPATRIYLGQDLEKRKIYNQFLGFSRIKNLSTRAKNEMPIVIREIIKDNSSNYINRFFNRAGNLSLKMHAFELLAGIGNRKAMEMVAEREKENFKSLEDLDKRCGIKSAELLAQRFVDEINDKSIQPRLVDLITQKEE